MDVFEAIYARRSVRKYKKGARSQREHSKTFGCGDARPQRGEQPPVGILLQR